MTTQDIDLGVLARGPQGPKGEQGNVGPAPTLKIGTVTKLGPDQSPTASLSGGNGSYTLNMGIPQGETNATATNALNVANSVDSKVTAIQANGGGRNYLRDSDKSISGWVQDLGTIPNEVLSSLAGETITISADAEWSDYQHSDSKQNRLGFELSVTDSDGNQHWWGAWESPTTPSGKERVSTTYTIPANVTFTVNNNGQNGYVSINGTGKVSHVKIEKGIVAHDWSPAPEDVSQAQWVTVTDTVDLNNIKTPCHEFLKGGATNAPNESAWWYLTVEGSESSRITQTAIADQSNNRYTRRFADSWTAWVRDATQTDVTALSNRIITNSTAIDANKTAAANAQNTANTAKSTADSALSKANSNATALNNKANKSDLTWSNVSGKPNVATKSDLTWANISGKPSIPDADATTTVSSGDLNNYTTTGKYYMPNSLSNYTNHPTTGTDMGNWFVMKVDAYHSDAYHSGDMIVQTIYQINTGDVWIRQRWDSAWKSWRQINLWS